MLCGHDPHDPRTVSGWWSREQLVFGRGVLCPLLVESRTQLCGSGRWVKSRENCEGIRGGNAVTTRPTPFQTYAVKTVLNNVLKRAPSFSLRI